ncbi:MAG TPA: nitroreductase/quinone reductase family protein [Ktedonobacterales bacterium]|jgi:deazaflavin-dependent oxidoreductase (nitroreductase family)
MTGQPSLPGWLKPANRIIILLERLGLPLGTMHLLSVPGRKSGQMRTTPVSLLSVDGRRYLVGGMINADWVKNARAAGWGILAYGRKRERVALTELPEAERGPILRVFPKLVPGGVSFFRRLYGLPSDPAALPDAFAALAPRSTVFQIAPLTGRDAGGTPKGARQMASLPHPPQMCC